MSLAVQKLERYMSNGVDIREFEKSLEVISDQLRLIDQKVIMKTEQEISNRYESERYEISKVKDQLKQIKS